MIKTIMVDFNTRLVVSVIETITPMYEVGAVYGNSVVTDLTTLPSHILDSDLYSLWHYTTDNIWEEHIPIPNTFYKWDSSTYGWVIAIPTPSISIIPTIKFQEISLTWVIEDSIWFDYPFGVDISNDPSFTTILPLSQNIIGKQNTYTDAFFNSTPRTYYLRPYWVDKDNITYYGTVVNTGLIIPTLVTGTDLQTNLITPDNVNSLIVTNSLSQKGMIGGSTDLIIIPTTRQVLGTIVLPSTPTGQRSHNMGISVLISGTVVSTLEVVNKTILFEIGVSEGTGNTMYRSDGIDPTKEYMSSELMPVSVPALNNTGVPFMINDIFYPATDALVTFTLAFKGIDVYPTTSINWSIIVMENHK